LIFNVFFTLINTASPCGTRHEHAWRSVENPWSDGKPAGQLGVEVRDDPTRLV